MEKYYLAALAASLGYASAKVWALVGYFGSAQEAYEAKNKELNNSGILQGKLKNYFFAKRQVYQPDELAEYCEKNYITILTSKSPAYPENLKQIFSPPVVLYVKGQLPNGNEMLGIVGSRRATPYGTACAEKFARIMAAHNVCIVSGGAVGIDTAAHKGALSVQGSTIAVLGSGFLKPYPEINRRLFSTIQERGALVTEFPPQVEPLPKHFPMRNRIIVGLSHGILVVEAAIKSGAVITANIALEEGKEVYAIPGNITSITSEGTNALIKDGARLVDSPQEILSDFTPLVNNNVKSSMKEDNLFTNLPAQEAEIMQNVLSAINNKDGNTLEEIVALTQLPLATLSNFLINLQIGGFIRIRQGHKYVRI